MEQYRPPKRYESLLAEEVAPSYLLSLIKYEAFFTLVTLILVVAICMAASFLGLDDIEWLGDCVWGTLVVGYFLLLPPFIHLAAQLRSRNHFGFWNGLRYAFVDVRLLLAPLPIIGLLVRPSESARDTRDEDE